MKKTFYLLLSLVSINFFAQSYDKCELKSSNEVPEVKLIDKDKLQCLAKNSNNKTLLITFGMWCEPCREDLPRYIETFKNKNVDVYLLLVDSQKKQLNNIVNYLKKEGDFVKPLKIDEVKYGKRLRKAYRNFLEDITPNSFEVVDDMSKLILINQNGQVEMITSYKDLDKGKWVKGQKDEGTINKILPLIQ